MFAWLLKLLPGGSTLMALAAVAAFGAGGWSGHWAQERFVDQPKIDELTAQLAQAKTDLATEQARFNAYQAQVARDSAAANAKALSQLQAEEAVAAGLRTQLAQAQAARLAASNALTAALNSAEALKASHALSEPALAYLASVRAEQGGGS